MSFYGSRGYGVFNAGPTGKSLLDQALVTISPVEVVRSPPTVWGPGSVTQEVIWPDVQWGSPPPQHPIDSGPSILPEWGWAGWALALGSAAAIGVTIYLARKT